MIRMAQFDIGAHFPAKFQGYCRWCSAMFMPREILTFVDDELLCAKCTYEAAEYNMWEEFMEGKHR